MRALCVLDERRDGGDGRVYKINLCVSVFHRTYAVADWSTMVIYCIYLQSCHSPCNLIHVEANHCSSQQDLIRNLFMPSFIRIYAMLY